MTHLETAIRKAVASAQFAEAERLLDDYVSELQRQMLIATRGSEMREAEAFLREMKEVAQLSRAHLASQLAALRNGSRFALSRGDGSTWRLDG